MPDQLPFSLSDENATLIQAVRKRNLTFATNIETANPVFFPPIKVRVLMVADGRLQFSNSPWGLSTFVHAIMNMPPRPYLTVELTVALRDSGATQEQLGSLEPWPATRIAGFMFSNPAHFKPEMYHQVWLFGDSSTENDVPPLTNDELEPLCQFMDRGGGVFATGDHGGIGSSLCGSVPRVRSMRKWFEHGGPFGEPEGPHMTNENRNDTVQPALGLPTGDESDDVPQEIIPKLASRRAGAQVLTVPHTILCGRNGVINILPDHPHEGECIEPHELDRTEFGAERGFHFVEYPGPGNPANPRILPEIIATSNVASGRRGNHSNAKSSTVAHSFGAICAYDGWQARENGVGRVVTDATWHHFINLNLVGASINRNGGFLTPNGLAFLETIREYYRNLVLWLTPRTLWEQSILHGVWICTWENRMLENVTPGGPVDLDKVDLPTLLVIGRHSRGVLSNFIGACQLSDWLLLLVEPLLPPQVLNQVRPWPRYPETRSARPDTWLFLDPLLDFALGGVIVAIRQAFPFADPDSKQKAEKDLGSVAAAGAAGGIRRGSESLLPAIDCLTATAEACRSI